MTVWQSSLLQTPWRLFPVLPFIDHHDLVCAKFLIILITITIFAKSTMLATVFLWKFHKNVKNLQNEKALDLHTLIPVHDHLQTYRLNSGLLTNLILISSCSTRSILILKRAHICSALTCKTKKWWLCANLQPSWQTANLGTNYVPLQKNTLHDDCQHWKLVLS